MLQEMLRKLQELAGRKVVFDPAVLNDPVAMKTAWTPARGGGANFRTHRLVAVDPNRMEFRATVGSRIFCLLFLLAGLGVSGLILGGSISGQGEPLGQMWMPLAFGLLFAAIGAALLYFATIPVVFALNRGCYWKGRREPEALSGQGAPKDYARLDEIHALQIIAEYCSGSKSSFYSYELNLVLKDGRRLNVVDHGNLAGLREDAARLARFLGRPLWDTLDGTPSSGYPFATTGGGAAKRRRDREPLW